MPFEFVDTHIHLIDQRHPSLRFSWLEPDFVHPLLGDIEAIKHRVYDVAAYEAESRFAGVTKCVNVQSALGTTDPVEETAWLQSVANETGWPTGIVAHVDLAADDAEAQLDRHERHDRLRGIRDFGQADFLADTRWRRGAALLAERDLLLDLACLHGDIGKASALAQDLPDLAIVLEHAGHPPIRHDAAMDEWRNAIAGLAEAPNVSCKISGLGMMDRRWTVESLRPVVDHCLDSFGIERCFFGSNWPVDRLFSSYDALVTAYRELVSSLPPDEQHLLFVANAERVYRI